MIGRNYIMYRIRTIKFFSDLLEIQQSRLLDFFSTRISVLTLNILFLLKEKWLLILFIMCGSCFKGLSLYLCSHLSTEESQQVLVDD